MGKSAPKLLLRSEKEIYYVLCMVNELRQVCVHHTEFGDAVHFAAQRFSNLYDIGFAGNIPEDAKGVLDRLYQDKLNSLKSFAKDSSAKNFTILFNLLSAENNNNQKAIIAQQYYNFSIRKSYKNIGFSIKTLREAIIEISVPKMRDQNYDSVRSKMYNLFDFILWEVYNRNPQWQTELVACLRAADGEESKQKVYREEAKRIAPELTSKINSLMYYCREIGNRKTTVRFPLSQADKELVTKAVDEVKIGVNASYFSKFIYLLTTFLDGKEINDLLTTLINKLENIAAFEKVIVAQYGSLEFTRPFRFFNPQTFLRNQGGSAITGELVDINSFARMGKIEHFTRTAYREAACLLGTRLTQEQLNDFVENTFYNKDALPKVFCRGKMVPDMGKRNFIINNVLKSRRFCYLVKYTDPNKIRKCACNPALVGFVLGKMEDTIIDRYAKLCCNDTSNNRAGKIAALTNLISGEMSLDFALDVKQQAHADRDPNKQRKIAAVSLYLNVLYQIAKNLVYVNSRYVMAFHALERDMCLHGFTQQDVKETPTALVQKALDEGWINKRAREYMAVNLQNSDLVALREFRNKTVHLNAIRKVHCYVEGITRVESYFELYHYIMQHELVGQLEYRQTQNVTLSPQTLTYMNSVKRGSWYGKDFVKALNAPFGYNLVRYKNLSIDALFDRNQQQKPEE